MADKAKFAFGSLKNLPQAIQSGAVDAFDLLCLVDDGVARIGWLDRNSSPVIIDVPEDDVIAVDVLPATGETGVVYIVESSVYIWDGAKFVSITQAADLSEFEAKIAAVETQVSAVETKVSDVEAKIAAVEEQVAAAGEQIASVETKIADTDAKVVAVEEQVSAVESKATALETELNAKLDADEADAKYLSRKYEVTHSPEGTLADYRDKEIRVMCPADTQWVLQQSGAGADPNKYYIGFKAYAPSEDVVSFKEDLAEIITDATMYYFEGNEFAGIDDDGRKYSIVWLPVAVYDSTSGAWTYYGANSSEEKYVGWYYSVEWYNADGKVVASDCIRINLSNEECYSEIKPFYLNDLMDDIKAEVKKYTDEMIEAKIEEVIEEITEIPVVEF